MIIDDNLVKFEQVKYIQTEHSKQWGGRFITFGIVIDCEKAKFLEQLGWKIHKGQWPDDEKPVPWLLITIGSTEQSVIEIPKDTQFVDVEIHPVYWKVGVRSGVKLFAKSIRCYTQFEEK